MPKIYCLDFQTWLYKIHVSINDLSKKIYMSIVIRIRVMNLHNSIEFITLKYILFLRFTPCNVRTNEKIHKNIWSKILFFLLRIVYGPISSLSYFNKVKYIQKFQQLQPKTHSKYIPRGYFIKWFLIICCARV